MGVIEVVVVMIPGDVDDAVAIDAEGDGVVGVGGVTGVLGGGESPGVGGGFAFGEDDAAVGVVKAGVLFSVACDEGTVAEDDGVDGAFGPAEADGHNGGVGRRGLLFESGRGCACGYGEAQSDTTQGTKVSHSLPRGEEQHQAAGGSACWANEFATADPTEEKLTTGPIFLVNS